MQLTVRSRLASTVVFAGVGALVVSPIAPQWSEMAVPTAQSSVPVELSALVNPIAEYGEAFSVAFQNAIALGQRVADNPAPILTQIAKNQLTSAAAVGTFVSTFASSAAGAIAETPQQVRTALDQFAAGDVTAALNTLLNTALGPIVQPVLDTLLLNPEIWTGLQNAIRQPVANTLAVIDLLAVPNVYNLLGPLLAPVQVLTDVTNAVGAAGDQIVAGVKTGDLEEIANALLSVGPDVTYALLNGTPIGGDYAAGLLGPQGIVAGVLTIKDMVADAITPPANAAGLSRIDATKVDANTVTLDVAPAAAPALPAKAPEVSAETPAAETVSTAPATEATAESTDAEAAADTAAVKDSPKAVPGKTGTGPAAKAVRQATKVSDGIRGALKDLGDGVKDATAKLSGKSAKPAKSESSAKSDTDSSAGASAGGKE